MNKKIIIGIALSSILLTGCFGSSTDSSSDATVTEGFHRYATEEFELQVPNDWEVITPQNFKSDTPGNTVVGFRSNLKNASFTANVIVLKNVLKEEVSTSDYAKLLYEKTKVELQSAREISSVKHTLLVADKDAETLYSIIEGKNSPDDTSKRFFQISAVKGTDAIVVVGAMLAMTDEATQAQIEEVVKSLRML